MHDSRIDETDERGGGPAATPGPVAATGEPAAGAPVTAPGADAIPVSWWRRIGRREWVIGGGIAILLALSPLTPDDWGVSLAIGFAMAALFLGYRAFVSPTAVDSAPVSEATGGLVAGTAAFPWVATLTIVGWLAAFGPTFQWMYVEWTTSVWQNNHGIFVPVLMWLLARSALKRDSGEPDTPSAWGYALLAVGLTLALIDTASNTRYIASVGLVISLPGLSLIVLGRRRTRATAATWLMGLFMLPLPTMAFHHVFLRNFTAAAITPVLQWMGLSALREQSVLTLPQGLFVVGDACSGFATLYSAFAVCVFLACFSRSPWRRVLLLASFAPLALAANVIRAMALILIAIFLDGDLLDTALHEASGVASFFLVLVVLYRLCDREKLQEAFA